MARLVDALFPIGVTGNAEISSERDPVELVSLCDLVCVALNHPTRDLNEINGSSKRISVKDPLFSSSIQKYFGKSGLVAEKLMSIDPGMLE